MLAFSSQHLPVGGVIKDNTLARHGVTTLFYGVSKEQIAFAGVLMKMLVVAGVLIENVGDLMESTIFNSEYCV